MSVTLSLHRGRSGFQSLQSEWESFACRYGTHFLHFPAWYGAELDHNGDVEVYFLTLREPSSSELLAVLPLQRCRCRVMGLEVPILQMYYSSEMGVNDVLSREPLHGHWQSIRRFLSREIPLFLFMRWQCVLENGWAITAAPSLADVRYTHHSKYLGFAEGYDKFMETLTPKLRNDLHKKTRKLEQLGELRLEVRSNPGELPHAFEQFLEVEDSGWKGKSGTSIRKEPKKEKYYRHLLEHYGRLGLCRINLLSLDGAPIAAQFGIEVGERLYLLKIGFQEQLASHSPGGVLLFKMVEHLCQHSPVRAINFITEAAWCDRWHPSAIRAGVFYTDCDTYSSRMAVRLLQWGLRWREQRRASAAAKLREGLRAPRAGQSAPSRTAAWAESRPVPGEDAGVLSAAVPPSTPNPTRRPQGRPPS